MPDALVTTVRDVPVLMFLTVTVTPGSTPPVASAVTPVMVPVVSCAVATTCIAATSSMIDPSLRMLASLSELRREPFRRRLNTKGT